MVAAPAPVPAPAPVLLRSATGRVEAAVEVRPQRERPQRLASDLGGEAQLVQQPLVVAHQRARVRAELGGRAGQGGDVDDRLGRQRDRAVQRVGQDQPARGTGVPEGSAESIGQPAPYA